MSRKVHYRLTAHAEKMLAERRILGPSQYPLQQINADVTMVWIGYRHYNIAPNHIWMFAPFHWPFKTELSEALHHITP